MPEGLVSILKTVDNIKSAIELGNSEMVAADSAKLAAQLAAGIAVESAIGTYSALEGLGETLSLWRMSKAISGQSIAGHQALAGLLASELVGKLIDQLRDLKPGSGLYDLLHPDSIPRNQRIPGGFVSARNFTPRRDPLALDLDNDGLETTGITATSQILFDHDGDGIKTGTGWVKGDDAFLSLDKNGNGTIDNGNELFGVDTVMSNGYKATNGFAALADLDSNHDGQFSSLDTQFANVRVWRDLNQDGISDTGELQSLVQAGITSINLSNTASATNLGNGNVMSAAGTFTKTNGTTGTAGDFTTGTTGNLDLVSNPFYRQFTDTIPLTAAATALPGLQGAGMVRDLQEAASLDAKLIQDIAAFTGLSRSGMLGQLDQLLQDWAGTANFKTSQQRAAEKGLTLMFKVPGATDIELQAVQIIGQPGFDKSLTLMTLGVSEERYNTVKAQVTEMGRMMGVLEAFNGQTFLNFGDDGTIKTGLNALVSSQSKDFSSINLASAGSETQQAAVSVYVFVLPTLTAQQVTLLNQSYDSLKQSAANDWNWRVQA